MLNLLSLTWLVVFLALALGSGYGIGLMARESVWTTQLAVPWFSPPGWMFAPVWFAMDICLAVAGWREWARRPKSLAIGLWFAQLALTWLWAMVFFAMGMADLSFAVILGTLAALGGLIVTAFRIDAFSSGLLVPNFVWLAFLSVVNLAIVLMN